MPREPGQDGGEQQSSNVSINVGDRARPGSVIGVNKGHVHVHEASSEKSAAVLLTSTGGAPAAETPLEGRWRAGEEGWLGDRRYLLWEDDSTGLIREYHDRSSGRVLRQAIARQIDPEPAAGRACVWLRHGGRNLTRERDLLARAQATETGAPAGNGSRRRQVSGFPRTAYYFPGPDAVTLALSWPSERGGLPAETLGVRFPPGSLDKWQVRRLLTGLRGLATTLERLHRLDGASHRNLSPQSIIVTDDGRFVLRDLGLAAVSFRPGEGPEGYQAPEQSFGSRLPKPGPATDVYQLAAVLYHLITGRAPGRNSPPARHEGLPGAVTDIIGAALAARPADRPRTHDLRMTLNDPGVTLQPET